MIHKMKLSKFWRLSLGLLLLGVGQRLIYTGAVSPWARDRNLPILLLVLSLVALGVGLALVLPLIVWFYKCYRSDKRLSKLILLYILGTVFSGFIIGLIGQVLYDHTSFAYHSVQTGIWATSLVIQSVLKLILCFGLVSIYKQLPIRSRRHILWLPLAGVLCTTICLVFVNYLFPSIGAILVSFVDAMLLIATFYYFMYMKKEMSYETTS